MIIETKFNCGDIVFTIYMNKICKKRVESISVREYTNNVNYPLSEHILYHISDPVTKEIVAFTTEGSLFRTKEELLQSL